VTGADPSRASATVADHAAGRNPGGRGSPARGDDPAGRASRLLKKSTRRHHAPLSLLNVPVRVPVRVPERDWDVAGHAHGQGHVQQAELRKR
jgi:hypothetical protein